MSIPVPIAILDEKMTAAGSPFELDEAVINGIPTRIWKNTAPSLRAIFEDTQQFAERDYLVYENERITYQQHYQQVVALAHALITDLGISKGDRVALAMRNYPEWPVVFWATVSIGAVIVPLNAWWTTRELEYSIENSGARLVFADQQRAALLAGTCDHIHSLDRVIVIRGEDNAISPNEIRFEDLLTKHKNEQALPPVDIAADDIASIYYTSGTTGKPKGAINSHRNICTNQISGIYLRVRTEYRYGREPEMPTEQMGQLISAPLFHVTGSLAMLCGSTIAGSKIVFMYKWDADTAIRLIEKEKLNSFGGVPSMPLQVLESPLLSQHDTSSVLAVLFGGAPPAPELAERIRIAFPNASSSNGYGLTETSGLSTVCVAEDYLAKPESAGMAAPVCDIKIVTEDGEQLPANEIGEICVKGPQVIRGYWNNPEATAKTITEGWLHTGDLGYLDDEDFLFVVDRAKDMLLRGGENIYCIEVESALYDHPAVIDAAVVGIPHPIIGEEVGALVQVRPGSEVSEKELQDHVAAQIAAYKVPIRIDQHPEPLPRNANGKIMKPAVKDIMEITNSQ
ncbi:MAG: long-chain fatty acid--CoA ligase [Gammaproteobacteria bacterium]|nr:MAG: long-chain fatty acid--CoA ligase [Gammaproteobacteria bacterium]RLA49972.1 MAG: long-chain fatty acid--CoA ligase [Gammaproteobacteria bacterium]